MLLHITIILTMSLHLYTSTMIQYDTIQYNTIQQYRYYDKEQTVLIPRNKGEKTPIGNYVDDLGKVFAYSESVEDLINEHHEMQKAELLSKSGAVGNAAGAGT